MVVGGCCCADGMRGMKQYITKLEENLLPWHATVPAAGGAPPELLRAVCFVRAMDSRLSIWNQSSQMSAKMGPETSRNQFLEKHKVITCDSTQPSVTTRYCKVQIRWTESCLGLFEFFGFFGGMVQLFVQIFVIMTRGRSASESDQLRIIHVAAQFGVIFEQL
jgi:hypothetical protein